MNTIYKKPSEWASLNLNGLPTSRQGIELMANRQGWDFRICEIHGKQYPLSALPSSAQDAYMAMQSPSPEPKRTPQAPTQPHTTLPKKSQNRIDAKVDILNAFNAYLKTNPNIGKTDARSLFASQYNARGIDVDPQTYQTINTLSAPTIARWAKAMADDGIQALGGKYGKKSRGIIDNNPELRGYLLALLNDHPHISGKLVMRSLRAKFNRAELPSYRTVQEWLKNWKDQNNQLMTAINNPDKWRGQFRAAGGRADANIMAVNQVWEMDSTPADIILADGKRHSIIGCIDVYTRRLTLHVSRTSKASAVAACLRKAITNWGLPETVKTDNGSDYVSKHMKRVFTALDIEQDICPPFSPERKPFIERAFKTFSHSVLELMPGFVGHNVAERKDIEERHAFSRRLMDSDNTITAKVTADELRQFCDDWCHNLYHHEMHAGLNNKTPAQMAREYTGELFTIADERALDILLLPTVDGDGWRTITKKGISADGARYDSHELGGLEGTQVQVLMSEDDWGHCYIFSRDGDFICKAVCPERTGVSGAEVASHRRRTQANLISEQKKEMRDLSREHKTKTVASDIMKSAAIEAGKVAEFPKAKTDYSNQTLDQLLSAHNANKPIYDNNNSEQSKVNFEKFKQQQSEKKVVKLPETPAPRYKLWQKLQADIKAGKTLDEFRQRWFETYPDTSEYKSFELLNRNKKEI